MVKPKPAIRICYKCHINQITDSKPYCHPCHASYMRVWRITHRLTPEQRLKDNARSYAHQYLKRGKIERKPCEVDSCVNWPQMHHDDYSKPLEVRWFCREHHLRLHNDYYFNPKSSYTPAALPAVTVPEAKNISSHQGQ